LVDWKELNISQNEEKVRKKIEKLGQKDLKKTTFLVDWNEIEIIKELGKGTFGSVYKAYWKGDLVAVKKFRAIDQNTELLKTFQHEMKLLCKMRHPNIVMIMGACCDVVNLAVIQELLKGDLSELLQSKDQIDWRDRLSIAMDAARGINYLHSLKPMIIHRDLKSNNLLIDEHWRVKVSDFGTAITKEKNGNSSCRNHSMDEP